MTTPDPKPSRQSPFAALVLIVGGLVVFVLSGRCTGSTLIEWINGTIVQYEAGFAMQEVLFGTAFMIVGAVLIWLGIREFRQR